MEKRGRASPILDRRSFAAATMTSAVAGCRLGRGVLAAAENRATETDRSAAEIIETSVHLLQWPSRSHQNEGKLLGRNQLRPGWDPVHAGHNPAMALTIGGQ